jgi:hypothetical protein
MNVSGGHGVNMNVSGGNAVNMNVSGHGGNMNV